MAGGSPPHDLGQLAELFDDPKPNVALVVGTGVSMGATGDPRASWKGLLLHGLEYCRKLGMDTVSLDAERVLLNSAFALPFQLREVLNRAEAITERLGGPDGPDFVAWLEAAFSDLKAPDNQPMLQAIADLARCGAIVLTTNYDDMLCDATGLPPVTWEEPARIIQAANRVQPAVIHIHGHWRRPTSVVLGQSSYERVKAAGVAQSELRALWTHWHWLYLGCGSGGLDDPNLGALLRWGKEAGLGEAVLSHYFLSTRAVITALPQNLLASANTITHIYQDHSRLPDLLETLRPEARPLPFEAFSPNARHVRQANQSPLGYPFPSWNEYLSGALPALNADEEVYRRFETHGWAFVLDAACKGKTTLAFRLAVRALARGAPAYYLTLNDLMVASVGSPLSPHAALSRLARSDVLFILDDAHQQPALARSLWQQWRERPLGSRLLILATRIDRKVHLPGYSTLTWLEQDSSNPSLSLSTTPDDLRAIANHVLGRLGCGAIPSDIDAKDIMAWHTDFRSEIGAFVVAVTQRRRQLMSGDYCLPPEAAADWIWERHLDKLSAEAIEDAVCFSVIGDPNIEIRVPEHALPFPRALRELLATGLVEQISPPSGHRYALQETSWAPLVLAALGTSPDRPALLAQMAAKDAALAATIASRIRSAGVAADLDDFWSALTGLIGEEFRGQLLTQSLERTRQFLLEASEAGQTDVADGIWTLLAGQIDRLAALAAEASPTELALFQRDVTRSGRDPLGAALWSSLEESPSAFVQDATMWPFDQAAALIRDCMLHKRNALVRAIWDRLREDSEALCDRASVAPLDQLAILLRSAAQHREEDLLDSLWRVLRAASDRLAKRLVSSSFSSVRAFLLQARMQGQDDLLAEIWTRLEAEIDSLALRARLETPNSVMGMFVLIPRDIRGSIVGKLKLEDWAAGPHRDALFSGEAPQLAATFALHGREDLKDALLENVLRRCNPKDFNDLSSAFVEISYVLDLTAPDQATLVEALIERVCSLEWLNKVYRMTSIGSLTSALHRIALRQPPRMIRRFWHPGLPQRLGAIARGSRLSETCLRQFVGLVGAAQLTGFRLNRRLVEDLPTEDLEGLPTSQPHRESVLWVERWQRQLWIGLRAMTVLGQPRICVDPDQITETLSRWRLNVSGADDWAGTKATPDTTAHRINLSMVNWLKECAAAGNGRLVSSPEPLWVLASFNRDPRMDAAPSSPCY